MVIPNQKESTPMIIADVIKKAIKMEEEGYSFYKKAEGCTKDKFGRLMYSSLAEYEVHHKKFLEGLLRNVTPTAKELDVPLPKDKLKSVFAGVGKDKDVCDRIPPTASDIDALALAMSKETESYMVYKDAAKIATDPNIKALFERMAKEENQHYEILEQTKYYLEHYANWSIWEEGGPIEGG